MRKFYALLAIIGCAALCLFSIEFYSITEYEHSVEGISRLFFGMLFSILFLVSLFYGIKNFKNTKLVIHFVPAFLSILFPLIIVLRIYFVNEFIDSPSQIKAFGGRHAEGIEQVILDFKKDECLLVNEVYGMSDLYYWGKYQQSGDTIFTHIKKHEIQFDTIILKRDTLHFLGDTNTYFIEHY